MPDLGILQWIAACMLTTLIAIGLATIAWWAGNRK